MQKKKWSGSNRRLNGLKSSRSLFILSLLPLLISCSSSLPRTVSPQKVSSQEQIQEVFRNWEGQRSRLKSLKMEVRFRAGGGLFRSGGEKFLFLARPASFRIEALNDFGLPASQVASNGIRATFYWPQENRYLQATAEKGLFERTLSIPLDPEKMVPLLMGLLPVEEAESFIVKTREKGKTLFLKGDESEIWVDAESLRPKKFRNLDTQGHKVYEVEFLEWTSVDEISAPQKVTLRFWRPRQTVTLEFEAIGINPSLPPKTFELIPPKDAEQIQDF
ncbi:MAG: hypothetical protein Q7S98_01060 [Deltaproteobacteria bacterium]|nr:hypothetical protein [Deltaproteobacteria bacterium]